MTEQEPGLSWDLSAHLRAAFAEGLVAEAVFHSHPDARLHDPRNPGFDVSSEEAGWRVDAKVASIKNVDLDESGMQLAIQWHTGKRGLIAESATHLGFVLLDEDASSLNLFAGDDSVLRAEGRLSGRVFLVPDDVIRAHGKRLWSPTLHRSTRGICGYLPLAEAEKHEVKFHVGSDEVVPPPPRPQRLSSGPTSMIVG